jgi:hypothetical protein
MLIGALASWNFERRRALAHTNTALAHVGEELTTRTKAQIDAYKQTILFCAH